MIFLNLVAFLLLVAGPLVGYHVAMRHWSPAHWQVMLWSAAGGAVAAVLLIGMLLLFDLGSIDARRDLPRTTLFIGEYGLFGLVLGFTGLLLGAPSKRRLALPGLVLAGLLITTNVAIKAAGYGPRDQDPSGVVFGPDSTPAAGVPVFLDRGSGPTERLTTDAAGRFGIRPKLFARGQPMVLICVPGGIPYVSRRNEYWLIERYNVGALPPRAIVGPGIRSLGWQRPIPRECLAGSAEPARPAQVLRSP